MAEICTVTTLRRKRDEIVSSICHYELQLEQAKADLAHVVAATRFISQSPHWLILIRCFFAWPICAQFNLTRVCALGLTISHAFKLEPNS